MLPLLLGLGVLGGAAYLGADKAVENAVNVATEATADVGVAVVSGAYTATKDAILRNTTEFFMAVTVLALTWGAVQYSKALLTKQ